MIGYKLYGSYLTFTVEQIIESAEQPMTVKEVSNKIAELESHQQNLLTRRVRLSLNKLVHEDKASSESIIIKNIVAFTYSSIKHEESI